MGNDEQEKLYDTAVKLIGQVAKLPGIRVNREEFLRQQFAQSPYLDEILADGPQSVYSKESLREKSEEIINKSTYSTTAVSVVSGLPSNPFVMLAAGSADVAQYFGFAINLAEQLAYLFGEDDLFNGDPDTVPEGAKIRIISYLGTMFGAGGAASLLVQTSKQAAARAGKQVAAKALTKTIWYPLLKKVGASLGYKITKQTVGRTVTKVIPIIGGIVSGGVTYLTFKPMGSRLADVFARDLSGEFDPGKMELNPAFEAERGLKLRTADNESADTGEDVIIAVVEEAD